MSGPRSVAGQALTPPQFRRGAEPAVLEFVVCRFKCPLAEVPANVRAATVACENASLGASHALRSLRHRSVLSDPARRARRSRRRSIRAPRSAWSSNGSTIIAPSRTMPHVPAAVRVLFHAQTFKEPENAGIYLGFIAGAIGSNPAKAEQLVTSFFPVPPEDEWVIVRAIAYSGLPDWRNLLRKVAPRMPGRQVMIDSYLAGTLPTLTDIPLEETKPGMLDKLRGGLHAQSLRQGRQEAEDEADLRQQSGSAGYAVGILFRDRLASCRSCASCRCCPGARAATPSTS